MTAKKTTSKKAISRKQAPAKKASAKGASAKMPAAKKPPTKAMGKKMSAINAAANVLAEAGEPLRAKEIVERMASKGYWKSPGGQTPWATLYSAIHREIEKKGKDARFKKADRGLFTTTK